MTQDKRHILVVDDESQIRQMLALFLGMRGFDVTLAEDGEEALKKLEFTMKECSLIVLDQILPGMHGTEILLRIRDKFPKLPVLLASGQDWASLESDLKQDSYTWFIAKPFEADELSNIIEKILNKQA